MVVTHFIPHHAVDVIFSNNIYFLIPDKITKVIESRNILNYILVNVFLQVRSNYLNSQRYILSSVK